MRTATALLLLCFILVTGTLLAQSVATGGISGVLTTEDGRLVSAQIVAIKASPMPPAPPVRITTGAGGSFSFTGMAEGPWELCPTLPAGGYIDPCIWERSGPMVTVTRGKTVSGVTIQLKKASTLQVRVDDPAHLVPITTGTQGSGPSAAPAAGPFLMMGVIAPGGRFHPIRQTAVDATGKDHQIDVPFDKPFRFVMQPVGLAVADSRNAPVAATGVSIPMEHGSSSPPPAALHFTVTGRQ